MVTLKFLLSTFYSASFVYVTVARPFLSATTSPKRTPFVCPFVNRGGSKLSTIFGCPFAKKTTFRAVHQNRESTTPWSVAFSTVTARNSTVGRRLGHQPYELEGYEMVLGKRCRFDSYVKIFRYITNPLVCANWCRRESSCLGIQGSTLSYACEAFTKCDEVESDEWVLYYRRPYATTARLWAQTSPSPDFFVDFADVSDVSSIEPVIQSHFASYSNQIKSVIQIANSSFTNSSGYPLTRLSESQALTVERSLLLAWRSRMIFAFPAVDGWVADVPPPPIEAPLPTSRPASSANYKCNQGTVDAACNLLKMNNGGLLFLMPWAWESLHNDMPSSPSPGSVSPLFTIVSLCYGEAPPTYNNELICPDPAMLRSIGALARSVFDRLSKPLYVSAILGTPTHSQEDGLPAVTHYFGSGVDFLCGAAAYGASERGWDRTCNMLRRYLFWPQHNAATPCDDVYFPARELDVGCGKPWWPIPTVHCDKTIAGTK